MTEPNSAPSSKPAAVREGDAAKWEAMVREMRRASAAADWNAIAGHATGAGSQSGGASGSAGGVDWSKLNPKDIGVHLGPIMTEEQFKAYRSRNTNVHVISSKSSKPSQ